MICHCLLKAFNFGGFAFLAPWLGASPMQDSDFCCFLAHISSNDQNRTFWGSFGAFIYTLSSWVILTNHSFVQSKTKDILPQWVSPAFPRDDWTMTLRNFDAGNFVVGFCIYCSRTPERQLRIHKPTHRVYSWFLLWDKFAVAHSHSGCQYCIVG